MDLQNINCRILLVEDNCVNQKLVSRILQNAGYEVDIVENGKEAVLVSELLLYDLMLMDIQMPEMDGLEATAAIRLREKATGRHTPIVALTANVMKYDQQTCMEAGMDDYLAKPVRTRVLFETIRRILSLSKGFLLGKPCTA